MSPLNVLTARQQEILHWVAQGDTNKGIAWRLGIAEHTVIQHLKAIYVALAVTNRVEASRVYLQAHRPHPKGPLAKALLSLLIEGEAHTTGQRRRPGCHC